MLFTPEETAAVDAEMEELARRRAAFKAKEEEERREAARKADGGELGLYGGGPHRGRHDLHVTPVSPIWLAAPPSVSQFLANRSSLDTFRPLSL